MGSVGGKDVAETTRNVMKNLMTNGLAAKMNFVGRGGKTAIKNMKLLHVIIGKNKTSFLFLYSLYLFGCKEIAVAQLVL